VTAASTQVSGVTASKVSRTSARARLAAASGRVPDAWPRLDPDGRLPRTAALLVADGRTTGASPRRGPDRCAPDAFESGASADVRAAAFRGGTPCRGTDPAALDRSAAS
jgi:hypothetical protein